MINKTRKLFLFPLLFFIPLLADSGAVFNNFGTIYSAVPTYPLALNKIIPKHTVQVTTAGSPSSCTVQLEGTLDDPPTASSTWAVLSGSVTCTSSVTFHVVDRPVTGIRVNVTALSGGTQANLAIKYIGVQ